MTTTKRTLYCERCGRPLKVVYDRTRITGYDYTTGEALTFRFMIYVCIGPRGWLHPTFLSSNGEEKSAPCFSGWFYR